ncbi:MAG TPA: TAXI family TRAP transporter solute-binding subunit [Burkholderiales bacterium]
MPRVIRETLVSVRELASTFGPFILIAIAVLALTYVLLDPAPPHHVVLGTGPEGSAYESFGKRYVEELKRYGITVELRRTLGSRDNLVLLRDGKERVDLAFVQGGASETIRAPSDDRKDKEVPLVSLGSLFYEPVWLFYRQDSAQKIAKDGVLTGLPQFRGLRINTGLRGSGGPGLTNRLFAANFVDREEFKRSLLDETSAVVGLLAGELDAMCLVSAPESSMVQMLLQTPGIKLFEFPNGEAYTRRYSYISPVTLPRSVADLSRDVPPRDIPLIAATTSLVAREGTHPALVQLFVQAASRIHGNPGWIARAGQFPSPQQSEFPLAKEAERYYRSGPPLLQRYLPFWLANLIDRMWVALVSIAVVFIPLSRLIPPLYVFRVRSRIFRWYRQLRQIEERSERKDPAFPELLAELDKLDEKATRINVPLAYTDELYALRQNIDLVRERLTQGKAA